MTPERMAGLVARWVRFYTRNLAPPLAERRIAEIDADLHDHIAHERADGTADWRIALSIAVRMLRGIAADVSWRGRTIARTSERKEETKMSKALNRPAGRIALVTALLLLVPLVLMLVTNEVRWGVFDFVLAAVLLGGTGLLLHALVTRKAGNIVLQAVAVAIGLAAMVLGEMDDAPGLGGFGLLLIATTVALAIRTAQRAE